ncbi:MAG TPA: C40 family peptidase [Gaiellaceae bacterium]|nr:C40 family peptidase [Gaiellaceae bacterium]
MRPIRVLILLFAIALALVLALVRPLQGRAVRATKRHGAHHAKVVREALRRRHLIHLHASPDEESARFGHSVVAYARHFLGIRYQWGGTSPHTGFDCSGLVRFVYGHFGIGLPHSSFGDLVRGHRVPRRWLRPGDLVFFSSASHVGIYAGGGRFIDAPHTGAVVRISTMREYGSSYYGARRFHGA